MITPNTLKLYPCPTSYLDHFVLNGRRYYKTAVRCLISDFGKYGMLPPKGRGWYLKIPTKDFNEAKKLYEIKRKEFNDRLNGNPNKGVQNSLF